MVSSVSSFLGTEIVRLSSANISPAFELASFSSPLSRSHSAGYVPVAITHASTTLLLLSMSGHLNLPKKVYRPCLLYKYPLGRHRMELQNILPLPLVPFHHIIYKTISTVNFSIIIPISHVFLLYCHWQIIILCQIWHYYMTIFH